MISATLDAIKATLKEKITVNGKPVTVRVLGAGERAGKKKLDTMESILIAITGWRKTQHAQSGDHQYQVRFVAMCGSKNKTADSVRTVIAAHIAAQVTKLLENQNWGLRADGVGKALFEQSADRTTREVADAGIALWDVSWYQEMPLLDKDLEKLAALYDLDEVEVETDLRGSLDSEPEMESSTTDLQEESAP